MMQIIWRLCTFRAGPQDIVYSVFGLQLICVIHFILQWGWLSLRLPLLHSALVALFSTALLLALPYLVVNSAKYAGRFLQTALALQLVSCVLHILLLALFLLHSPLMLLNYYLIFSFILGAALFSHIIKEAIVVKLWQAVLIVLIYFIVRTVSVIGLM
ncbi:hypothetical protein Psal006b_02635 [Piscirickettsia salmonis]|uniref:Membrane protein n=1 Tax=Piscirickettsia salmonis TaxID=1238 RepID=A0A1L6T9P6_PISSA|nr:hypothetical protein [Piscirickettsia salmonis]AKP73107.2 hypothetical protein PSLF89_1091 [Piscirickettsia salmonis LF-89 = ATCC VR-1361]ALB21765.1 membrane protein [Piscirickettsia salmonis]ALY01950.1 hypothetical protein AWE47_02930 [Piscirickettsia salmonis]AMA41459.1 hypothetical protein AWJ11_02915 [Piscirickettsia salmonis]AOS33947.1 hypothetical protein AVM72_00170 [Piscirickettsia salmonis]